MGIVVLEDHTAGPMQVRGGQLFIQIFAVCHSPSDELEDRRRALPPHTVDFHHHWDKFQTVFLALFRIFFVLHSLFIACRRCTSLHTRTVDIVGLQSVGDGKV